jgi:hypothetical protein
LRSIILLQQQQQPGLLAQGVTPLPLLLLGSQVLLWLLLQAQQLLQQWQVDTASPGWAAQQITQQLLRCRTLIY